MGSDKKRGRADASKGKYNPPSEPLAGLLSRKKDIEKTSERKAEYDEGYHDKKREMKKNK